MSSCLICDETSFKALENKFNDLNEGNDIGLRSTILEALLWIDKTALEDDENGSNFYEFSTSFVGVRFRKYKRQWRRDCNDRCGIIELYCRFKNNKISKRWMSDFQSWWYLNFDGQDGLYFELWKTDFKGRQNLIWADYREEYKMTLKSFKTIE